MKYYSLLWHVTGVILVKLLSHKKMLHYIRMSDTVAEIKVNYCNYINAVVTLLRHGIVLAL